jgi:acetate kinase
VALDAPLMKILVLNAGSGSQRCSLFDLEGQPPAAAGSREPVWEATLDSTAPGQPAGQLRVKVRRGATEAEAGLIDAGLPAHERVQRLLRGLWEGPGALLRGPDEIHAIGHRIVHGGDRFDRAVFVDAAVEETIDRLSLLAPSHNPAGLAGIRAARELCGTRIPHVAVFDTAFHRTLSEAAATYAGPYEWREEGIRRYGFHGTNFRWVAERAARMLGRTGDPDLTLILCHLGGGCSLCATRGGRSIDTTMGFTPLDGIAMSTRSGALDPGIMVLLQRQGKTAAEIDEILNRQSGLKGVSGISGDTRELFPLADKGNPRAELALDVFVHRLRAGIGQMLAALGERPAAVVFTDAIAEDEPRLRAAACEPFGFVGLSVDPEQNDRAVPDAFLSTDTSEVKALLIKSREAWQIARECRELMAASP